MGRLCAWVVRITSVRAEQELRLHEKLQGIIGLFLVVPTNYSNEEQNITYTYGAGADLLTPEHRNTRPESYSEAVGRGNP